MQLKRSFISFIVLSYSMVGSVGLALDWTDPIVFAENARGIIASARSSIFLTAWGQENRSRFYDIHTSFFVNRLWQPSQSFQIQELGHCTDPKIKIGTLGKNALLGCTRHFGNTRNLWISRWQSGRWQAIERIAEVMSDSFEMGISAEGRVFVVWLESGRIKSRVYNPETGWTEIVQINRVPEAREPHLAVAPTSEAMLVWVQPEKTEKQVVQSLIFSKWKQGQWSIPQWLEKPVWPHSSQPFFEYDQEGNGLLVWAKDWLVRYRRYDQTGWFSFPKSYLTKRYPFPKKIHSLQMAANGSALVTWSNLHSTGRPYDIWASFFRTRDRLYYWDPPAPVVGFRVETYDPFVASEFTECNDNALFAWTLRDEDETELYVRTYSNKEWGSEEELIEDNGITHPLVAIDSSYKGHVFWEKGKRIWNVSSSTSLTQY